MSDKIMEKEDMLNKEEEVIEEKNQENKQKNGLI